MYYLKQNWRKGAIVCSKEYLIFLNSYLSIWSIYLSIYHTYKNSIWFNLSVEVSIKHTDKQNMSLTKLLFLAFHNCTYVFMKLNCIYLLRLD